jgi:hypothetical protein
MEAERTSETSVGNYFTRQYIPEDHSELKDLILKIDHALLYLPFTEHASHF